MGCVKMLQGTKLWNFICFGFKCMLGIDSDATSFWNFHYRVRKDMTCYVFYSYLGFICLEARIFFAKLFVIQIVVSDFFACVYDPTISSIIDCFFVWWGRELQRH